jgi:hypothetical protein
MHRTNRLEILIQDALQASSTLRDIPPQAAKEPKIIWSIHVDDQVCGTHKTLTMEDQDALDEEQPRRLHPLGMLSTRMGGKVVDRQLGRLSSTESIHMILEQLRLERIGVVEIEAPRVSNIAVIAVMGDQQRTRPLHQ